MGIFDAIRHQLIDIIEWNDDTRDTMVWRFPRFQDEIKNGAKLVVRESQVAAFINQGQLADVFQPGTYTLETKNMPVLSSLLGWKYGFNSPFKAEVYFVSTRIFTDRKFGTKNPIMLRDTEFGMVRLRAFGNFSIKVSDAGTFVKQIAGTGGRFTLDELDTQPLPGGPTFNCKGLFGTTCGTPAPEWRHKLRVTWSTPYSYGDWFKSLSLSAQWRYFGKTTLDAFSSDPQLNNPGLQYETDRTFSSHSYLDLTANFTVHNNLNFRVGVNNVFDKDPPITGSSNCPAGFCNGGTYPQIYDALGRFVFVGLSADF